MYVKICGLTNLPDAAGAAEAGADLLGFIFYPPSPRSITVEEARPIVWRIHRLFPEIGCVGVFVDEPVERVLEVVDACGVDLVQLHGQEPPEMVERLSEAGIPVIKGFRLRDRGVVERMRAYRPTLYLVDAYVPGKPGGTGVPCDWELAAQVASMGPLILAGGLTPENVAQAIRAVRPWGVDTASGVEAEPGYKDAAKVRAFVRAAKEALPAGLSQMVMREARVRWR